MKTELKFLNRAFRKEVKHWLGKPNGFANKKHWKNWCRENACALESVRRIEGVAEWEVRNDQCDADSVVTEDMSNW